MRVLLRGVHAARRARELFHHDSALAADLDVVDKTAGTVPKGISTLGHGARPRSGPDGGGRAPGAAPDETWDDLFGARGVAQAHGVQVDNKPSLVSTVTDGSPGAGAPRGANNGRGGAARAGAGGESPSRHLRPRSEKDRAIAAALKGEKPPGGGGAAGPPSKTHTWRGRLDEASEKIEASISSASISRRGGFCRRRTPRRRTPRQSRRRARRRRAAWRTSTCA